MAEVTYPTLSRHRPSPATPPGPGRVSDRMWSANHGIVFSKPQSPASSGIATRAASDSRAVSSTSSLHRRAWSSSSLESLGRNRPAISGQSSAFLPAINRVRSNDELHVPKRRLHSGAHAHRPLSTKSKHQAAQHQPPKQNQVSRTRIWLLESTHDILEKTTLVLRHWMAILLGLPSLSLNFAGSSSLESVWSIIFGSSPKPLEEPVSKYWTYEVEAKKTGVLPKVRLCTDKATSDKVAAQFLKEPVLGFDLEWEASASSAAGPKRNVSLVQVAKKDLIALFHIARFSGEDTAELMPPNLKLLIENPSILKTGVNIAGDCTRLRRNFNVQPKGIFELSHVYRLVKYHDGPLDTIHLINKRLVSLATQAEEHLGLPLSKDMDVRASKWSKPLSAEQKLYAASDAYACYRLFHILDKKRTAIDPAPPRPALHEHGKPILLAHGRTVDEYLAEQWDDEDIVREVIRSASEAEPESESSAAEEEEGEEEGEAHHDVGIRDISPRSPSALPSVDSISSSNTGLRSAKAAASATGKLSSIDEQLIYAASVFAEERHAKLETEVQRKGTRPLRLRRQLQAYFLWHTKELDASEVARLLLIKPPSVACYVLDTIALAKLPYDSTRVQREILPQIPPRVRSAKGWMIDGLEREMDKDE